MVPSMYLVTVSSVGQAYAQTVTTTFCPSHANVPAAEMLITSITLRGCGLLVWSP